MRQLAAKLAIGLLQFYRFGLSTSIGPACRFEPTCSVYAIEAIEAFGVAKGSRLAARRIARCHPFGGIGYDPVPAAGVPRGDGRCGTAPRCQTRDGSSDGLRVGVGDGS